MVTLFSAVESEDDMKNAKYNYKQVAISVSYVQGYIDAIGARVKRNGETLQKHAAELDPPYPLELEGDIYHLRELDTICHSTILKMHSEMREISLAEWKTCLDEYQLIPARDMNAEQYPALSEKLVVVVEKIGEYLETLDIKIPYLRGRKAGSISYRIVMHLAIIWLGRQLKEETKATKSPQNS